VNDAEQLAKVTEDLEQAIGMLRYVAAVLAENQRVYAEHMHLMTNAIKEAVAAFENSEGEA
jgi:hypothetical protein